MKSLLQAFINDVKIEAIKFQLQTSHAHDEVQRNDIIGNFEHSKLDSGSVSTTISQAMRDLKALPTFGYQRQLARLVKKWNENRIKIQYEGYGYGEGCTRRSEAYSYVLLLRILKKNHKELYAFIKPLINT
jgi:hypothetical protein